jgi:outer membrane receptor protein involved in Fe transport
VPVCGQTYVTLDVDNLFNRTYQELPGVNQAGRFVMAGMQVVF